MAVQQETAATMSQPFLNLLAEREGFEPPVPLSTPVFKTGVIDHSTISPKAVNEWVVSIFRVQS